MLEILFQYCHFQITQELLSAWCSWWLLPHHCPARVGPQHPVDAAHFTFWWAACLSVRNQSGCVWTGICFLGGTKFRNFLLWQRKRVVQYWHVLHTGSVRPSWTCRSLKEPGIWKWKRSCQRIAPSPLYGPQSREIPPQNAFLPKAGNMFLQSIANNLLLCSGSMRITPISCQ